MFVWMKKRGKGREKGSFYTRINSTETGTKLDKISKNSPEDLI